MGLKTRIALGVLTIVAAATATSNVIYLAQRQQAMDALKEASRLTQESVAMDSQAHDKARYEGVIASLDKALSEVNDFNAASRFGQPAAIIDEWLDYISTPAGQQQYSEVPGLWHLKDYGGEFPIADPDGKGTPYIYLPGDSSDKARAKDALDSAKEAYAEAISSMKWDVEYFSPNSREVFRYLGITYPLKEAIEESKKAEHQVLAKDSAGRTQSFTEAELIVSSARFIPYLNKPLSFDASPEPVDVSTYSLAPFPVDTKCLEQRVSALNASIGVVGEKIAPRVENGMLYGFAIWVKTVGGGALMKSDEILALGKHCEVTVQ